MTKQEQKALSHQQAKTNELLEQAIRGMSGFTMHVDLLTGAIADLSSMIGSNPDRALKHLQATSAILKQLRPRRKK